VASGDPRLTMSYLSRLRSRERQLVGFAGKRHMACFQYTDAARELSAVFNIPRQQLRPLSELLRV